MPETVAERGPAAPASSARPVRLQALDADARERLHEASLTILERTGVAVRHAGARDLLARAGAAVQAEVVRIPGGLVEVALASAPRSWKLHHRGSDGSPLELAQGHTWYGSGPDCPYVRDPLTGDRRRARLADVSAAARLAEALPHIGFVMSMGLPEDLHPQRLEAAQFAAMAGATSKPIVLSSPFGEASLRQVARLAGACGEPRSIACLVMTSPPLALDESMSEKTLACAELEIPLIVATSPSAGSTAPATPAGAVAVANAEVLATLVLHQLHRPGAPFVCGAACGIFDMRTMVDAYGPPGVFLANQAGCELAAWYGLPSWGYAGHSDSKLLDEQWGLDAGMSTLLGRLSGATLLHDVGYLESGMQSSAEALVAGDELAGWSDAFAAGLPVADDTLRLDEIDAAGPGGNHLARPHTRSHYRDHWRPGLIDHQPHDRWEAGGRTTFASRARTRTLDLLAAEPPFVPAAEVAELLAGVIAGAVIQSDRQRGR